ncbi:MAG: phosphoenolpyruvate--protein phosphotransferase [Victivallales bacterium]|nr:phosphoenolpyruvate--protein phosphotransferase [Victivallales bacterium]
MRANKYQVVHGISEVIARTSDPWKGLAQVTELIAHYAGAEACALFAYNRATESLSLVASHNLVEKNVSSLNFGIDRGIAGLSVRALHVINIDDRANRQDSGEGLPPLKADYHGALGLPLVVGGSAIGALLLMRELRRKFSESVLEMLDEIAPPLAVFIVNAMLVRRSSSAKPAFAFQASSSKDALPPEDHPLRGRSVTGGVVCGRAVRISCADELLSTRRLPPPGRVSPAQIQAEKALFQAALEDAKKTARRTVRELAQSLSEADCDIFEMHAMLLDDPTLQEAINKRLDEGHTLTNALAWTLRSFADQYSKVEDEYLRERLYDIKDILLNIKTAADNLRGTAVEESNAPEAKRIVVVAKELLPSQLVGLPLKKVTGILCDTGGMTSHVAILARALQKTMVVGLSCIEDIVPPGARVLLDGNAGLCYINPSMKMVRQYGSALHITRERQTLQWQEDDSPREPDVLADGTRVHFAGNLALLSEMPAIHHFGLDSVGLYRTEFMFMIRNHLPSEEEQFQVLKRLLTTAKGIPVTIRVLDAGGDKPLPYLGGLVAEDNPALGLRGLRFLLSHPEILTPHLRALLRASAFGKVNIMFPMVADLFDLHQALKALKAAGSELDSRKVPYDHDCKVGVMLEVPSAFHGLPDMLPYIDFVSIGTNDLVQYLFAVDRGNPAVLRWYRQCHPLVLRLIRDVCRMLESYPDKSLSICGELAGSSRALPLLLGAGLRNFSMNPFSVTRIREAAAKLNLADCRALLDKALRTCDSEMDVNRLLAAQASVPAPAGETENTAKATP